MTKKKILLVQPPWLRFFGCSLDCAPIGIGYIGSYLRSKGYFVEVYNADYSFNAELKGMTNIDYTLRHYNYLRNLNDKNSAVWNEVKETIKNFRPEIVGVNAMTSSFQSALYVARIAKSLDKNILTVLGGPHPTLLSDEVILNKEIDCVVRSEGEITFTQLVESNDKKDWQIIEGITFKKDGEIINTPQRKFIDNLDEIPFPLRTSEINQYTNQSGIKLPVVTSRGCAFNCIYCGSNGIWGRKVRFRTARNVVDEIKDLKNRFGAEYIGFEDDSFTINNKHCLEICSLLKSENIDINWSCLTRADLINENTLDIMREAGCSSVYIGIESGSNRTLELINKNITIRQIENAVEILRKHKLKTYGFFMYGFPWENKSDLRETIKFAKKLNLEYFEYNIATPLPGTELFKILEEDELIESHGVNWSKLHQGSPEMFFTKKYTQEERKKIILNTQRKFKNILTPPRYTYIIKYIVKHPFNNLLFSLAHCSCIYLWL